MCGGYRQSILSYYCDSCSKIRRYILNFGTREVLESIEGVYIKSEKLKPKNPTRDDLKKIY